jgi:hypothetical protein
MTETSAGSGTAPARPGLAARLVGTLFSPKDTFAAVSARPRWFGAVAIAVLISGAAQFALLSTDVGQQLALDQQVGYMEAFGQTVTDEQYASIEQGIQTWGRYTGPLATVFFTPLALLVSAGILHVMFGLIGGGNGTFKQMYAISAHASIITALQLVFTTVVTLAAGRAAAANLAAFTPTLEETTFTYRLLSTIDVFYVWSTFVTAVGVAVLYKKRTGTVAMILFGIYVAIALIIAFARSGS